MSADEFFLISAQGQKTVLKAYQLLGRDASCDIVLTESQPSRRHAEIRVEQGKATLCDLGSTNGSYINEVRVDANQPVLLKRGDKLRFDASVFTFDVVDAAANATVMRPAPTAEANATVMRAIPAVEATEAKTPEKPSTPQSWALGGQQAVAGTQLLSGTQLEGIRASLNASLTAQNVDAPTLILASGKQFRLSGNASNKWEIGRALTCDIVIEDGSVSNNHAQIINDGSRWKLIDLMSANGTYVNGEKGLTTYLSGGDQIRFGTVDAVFQLAGGSTTEKSSPATKKSAAGATSSSNMKIGVIAFAATLAVLAAVLFFLKS